MITNRGRSYVRGDIIPNEVILCNIWLYFDGNSMIALEQYVSLKNP